MEPIRLAAFPFDSQITGYSADGLPEYDRASNSEEFAGLLKGFFRDGVFDNGALQVLAGGGLTATVSAGGVMVQGRVKHLKSAQTVEFETAASLPRLDRVIVRRDLSNAVRDLVLDVLTGTPASTPSAPALTRNGTVWEICLATVRIAASATSVSQSAITDTRLDSNLCGIVAAVLSDVDTSTFYAQVQSDLLSFKNEEQAEFEAWFQNLQEMLNENVASNLQNQINVVKETAENAVSYESQALTNDQKSQARENISALAIDGTAANSALLDGKNPQHYVTVHNILTNSDWRIKKKIINQRGKTEYTSTNNKNTIDRWKTYGQVYVHDGYIRFANAGMEGTTYLYQHHPVGTFEVGKTYTAACMLRNGTVCVGSGVAVNGTGVTVFQSGNFLLRFHPNRNGETDAFIIGFSTSDQSADIQWAVFCEGEYTANEVKKFVEKRYTEDLLECQRWLYVASGYAAWTGYKSSTPYFFVELPTQMAGTPTVSADEISVYSTLNAGRQQSASVSTASHGTHGNKVRVTITTDATVANTQPLTCVTNNLMASCEL